MTITKTDQKLNKTMAFIHHQGKTTIYINIQQITW